MKVFSNLCYQHRPTSYELFKQLSLESFKVIFNNSSFPDFQGVIAMGNGQGYNVFANAEGHELRLGDFINTCNCFVATTNQQFVFSKKKLFFSYLTS